MNAEIASEILVNDSSPPSCICLENSCISVGSMPSILVEPGNPLRAASCPFPFSSFYAGVYSCTHLKNIREGATSHNEPCFSYRGSCRIAALGSFLCFLFAEAFSPWIFSTVESLRDRLNGRSHYEIFARSHIR